MPTPPFATGGITDRTTERFFCMSLFVVLRVASIVSALLIVSLTGSLSVKAEPIFLIKQTVTLSPMHPGEIFTTNSDAISVDEGDFSTFISSSGEVSGSALSVSDLDQVYTDLTFSRWTNSTDSDIDPLQNWLWLLAWPVNEMTYQNVTCTIADLSGKPNRFSHVDDASSYLEVTILNTLSTSTEEQINGETHTVYRGLEELQFDLTNAKRSGVYKGNLTVTVEYL